MISGRELHRPETLRMFDDIKSGTKKYIFPAGKYLGKELMKDTVPNLPTVGSALGATLGAEFGPTGIAVGEYIGKKSGQLAKKEIVKAIDKL